jgi:glycosyltransferase involved in cell wall biosynthesis
LAAQELRSIANGYRDFEISLIGPDNSDGVYKELVDKLNLDSVVSVKPPVPYRDIPKILTQYDVALAIIPGHPLDWKYHPTLKVLEYRAIGMPIIATDFEPNREVVEHGINGLLVSNTPEDIAQAMQRFVCEVDFLQACRLNAQEMRQGLLWKDISGLYEQLYQSLVHGV